jgi:hypothetical protein
MVSHATHSLAWLIIAPDENAMRQLSVKMINH